MLFSVFEKDHLLLIDIPGAKRHYDIAWFPIFEEIILNSLKSRNIHAGTGVGVDCRDHVARVDSLRIRISPGINIRHQHFVRVAETLGVFIF